MIEKRAAIASGCSVDEIDALAREAGFYEQLDLIRRFTKKMFPDDLREEVDYDPDEPSDRFVLFSVNASGEVDELVEKQLEWHRRVDAAAPDSNHLFRITVNMV